MRIVTTKQPGYLKELSYAELAAGTTSDVWFDEDADKSACKSHSSNKEFDA